MKSFRRKVLYPFIVILLLFTTKYILWDLPISSGKRVGNLTKISKKGKFWFIKTWEGTIDEGSGDKLTSYFSVRDEKLAQELYSYEGREVILYYEQYLMGWPRDTNYVVVSWKSKNQTEAAKEKVEIKDLNPKVMEYMGKTMFCALLGTIYQDADLYNSVKKHVELNNLYLYKQFDKCNE